MEWARRSGLGERYGVGKVTGSWYPILDHDGQRYPPIAVWTSGEVEIPFCNLKSKPPFDDPATRHDYAERLRAIPGVAIPADTEEQPLIPLTTFSWPRRWPR